MTKKIIIIAVAVIALGAGAMSYLRTPSASTPYISEVGTDSAVSGASAVSVNPSATGTVAVISADKMTISSADGATKAYILNGDSSLLKFKSVTSAAPGASVVVVYSKALGKPITALLSDPFTSTDTSIEIISGKLVSIQKNVLSLSVGGETKSYEFDGANPLSVVSPVSVKEIKAGDSVTIEYSDTPEGRTVVRATFFE